jgi:hypothetical protein
MMPILHIQHGDAFGDAYDQFHLGVDGFQNGICREGWGHVDDRGICLGLGFGFVYAVEHGQI